MLYPCYDHSALIDGCLGAPSGCGYGAVYAEKSKSQELSTSKIHCTCFMYVLYSPTNTLIICADVVTINDKVSE